MVISDYSDVNISGFSDVKNKAFSFFSVVCFKDTAWLRNLLYCWLLVKTFTCTVAHSTRSLATTVGRISDETFYTQHAQSQIMVEKVPEFSPESLCLRQGMVSRRRQRDSAENSGTFVRNFDSVYRMFHQILCFQSPKTFTPKYQFCYHVYIPKPGQFCTHFHYLHTD